MGESTVSDVKEPETCTYTAECSAIEFCDAYVHGNASDTVGEDTVVAVENTEVDSKTEVEEEDASEEVVNEEVVNEEVVNEEVVTEESVDNELVKDDATVADEAIETNEDVADVLK